MAKKSNILKQVSTDTWRGVGAVALFALATFFGLSAYGAAGLAGNFVFGYTSLLFGSGHILIPLGLIVVGINLLRSREVALVSLAFGGGAIFVLSLLGIVELAAGGQGGWLGKIITWPFIQLFDTYVSFVFLTALLVISTLVAFNTRLPIEKLAALGRIKIPKLKWGRAQENAEEVYASVAVTETENNPAKEIGLPPANVQEQPKTTKEKVMEAFSVTRPKSFGKYTPPPLSLLEVDRGKPSVGDIKASANIIKRTLANFGINVEMDEVSIGPSFTRYALKPAEGIKLSRITGLQNDLSLALAAHPLRIEAPIPGKSLVGIEIPNTTKAILGLGSILSTKEFLESAQPLLVALGRSITGAAHFLNISRAPHALVAGATGSGKSILIHSIITSLLYRNSPDNLRFIMVDPKRVELPLYNGIPHLLTPVLTNPKRAIAALKWAGREMDRRYEILEKEAARDIASYHQILSRDSKENDMPYLVIIIDELADIMSTYPRELEASIVRLAQMSRAVGIHLVISTQRPSIEVITGLIKANIPTRVALQVASQIDSRTILDMSGAQTLLGAGDMLYMSAEMGKPVRLQSAYISEAEVKQVVKHLHDQYKDDVSLEVNLEEAPTKDALWSSLESEGETGGADDELYEEAKELVIKSGKASASYLQRRLKVGYARAARLLDILEERGVIGPGEGAKPREVYIKPESGTLEPDGEDELDDTL